MHCSAWPLSMMRPRTAAHAAAASQLHLAGRSRWRWGKGHVIAWQGESAPACVTCSHGSCHRQGGEV